MTNPIDSIIVTGQSVVKNDFKDYVKSRLRMRLTSSGEIQSLTIGAQIGLDLNSVEYEYDVADTTSAHNGTSVLVSADGRRYKPSTKNQLAAVRNTIINGAFDWWQRGTSLTVTNSYHADRWAQSDGGGYTATISRQATTTTEWTAGIGSKYFMRVVKNNAVVSAIIQRIEDLQQFNNSIYTVSFWMKSSTTTTNPSISVYAVVDGSTLGAALSFTGVTTPTLSSTWQKYVYTITIPALAPLSGAHHLRLQMLDAATANTYDIAEVQLEHGSVTTGFDRRNPIDELLLCQRYYEKSFPQATAPAQNAGVTGAFNAGCLLAGVNTWIVGQVSYKVTKRTSPTVTLFNPSAANGFVRNLSTSTDSTAVGLQGASDTGFGFFPTGIAGWAQGHSLAIHWVADSEI